MKITRVNFDRLELRLTEPYTIAYENVDSSVNFILEIHTDKGITGFGCAAPDKEVTLETPAEVEQQIRSVLIPYLQARNPLDLSMILQDLSDLLRHKGSVLAMVDMALLDIAAKKMKVPLYQLLGGYRQAIPTSITIGILPLDQTLTRASEFVKKGFSIIKLKGGLDVEQDIEKVIKLREMYPELTLRFDANQGYDLESAQRFFRETQKAGIEIFEQPSPVADRNLLAKITQTVKFPVMADESIKSAKDVFDLARKSAVDMINIKLMKVGGIREGMHMNSVARSAGLESMVGCLDECALGISAGLHFALSRPNIRFADLDGHLDLEGDPFQDLFSLKKGILYPSKAFGLGKV